MNKKNKIYRNKKIEYEKKERIRKEYLSLFVSADFKSWIS